MPEPADSLIRFMVHSAVPHRVTSVLRTANARSFHFYGQAVDFAGPTPSWDSPALRSVYRALEPLGPGCLELIYAGPGGGYWKNGRQVAPYSAASHHDHVHIAMPAPWRWQRPEGNGMARHPAPAPIVAFHPTPSGNGYWIVLANGWIYAFGDAPRFGDLEIPPEHWKGPPTILDPV